MEQCKNNRAIEIGIDYMLKEYANITLYGWNVFETRAKKLVSVLKQLSSCSCDFEDEDEGINYEFKDIGIRLWREHLFYEKLFSDKEYMEKMKLVIDDMLAYLYFQIVAVRLLNDDDIVNINI